MQWLVILVVAWVVISAIGNKKKQQARAEAEKQAAEKQAAARPAPQPPPQARPAAPFSPYFPDVQAEGPVPPAPGMPQARGMQPPPRPVQQKPMREGMQAAPVTRMQQGPASSLTELHQTERHTLTPSGKTGHAHQETSMTGFEPDCPPEKTPRRTALGTDAYAGMPAFTWKPDAVLNGMVYAEILARPKALRR